MYRVKKQTFADVLRQVPEHLQVKLKQEFPMKYYDKRNEETWNFVYSGEFLKITLNGDIVYTIHNIQKGNKNESN